MKKKQDISYINEESSIVVDKLRYNMIEFVAKLAAKEDRIRGPVLHRKAVRRRKGETPGAE